MNLIRIRLRACFFVAIFLTIACSDRSNNETQDGHIVEKPQLENTGSRDDEAVVPDVDTEVPEGRVIDGRDSVMFDLLVESYEDPDRNAWQNPELVIRKIDAPQDKTVADVGAGTGYFTFRLARWCRQVIALEIDPDFITYLEDRKQDLPGPIADRITIRETPPDSAALKPGEADVVMVVNTYYFLSDRVTYFSDIRKNLSTTGQVIIVDYKEVELPVEAAYVRRIAWQEVAEELRRAGYRKVEADTTSLPYQYIVEAYK